ncbi:hypothetical protein FO519_009024 [Halicephalobus sp. NKZ332]|nr:hypothetical protein FO519_009024 [Halicephalobus sp. NKZ332]
MSLLRRFACIQSISKNKSSWSPEFIIDKRKGEREIVLSDWKMKKSGRSVRVEKADIKDLETIASQICEGFVNTNSLFIKLGATVEEIIPMFRERTRSILNQKLSLIAFDEKNRLVGMLGCRMDGIEEIEKFFGPRGEPVLEFQDDYAQG